MRTDEELPKKNGKIYLVTEETEHLKPSQLPHLQAEFSPEKLAEEDRLYEEVVAEIAREEEEHRILAELLDKAVRQMTPQDVAAFLRGAAHPEEKPSFWGRVKRLFGKKNQ